MKISENGINNLEKFEGFRQQSYPDSRNIWTIGYGTTHYFNGKAVQPGQLITHSQALIYLESHCNTLATQIEKLVIVDLNQNQIDAVIILVYNIGIGNFQKSTLLKCINDDANKFDIIKPYWLAYNMAGGVHVQGLLNRREAEFKLYCE